MSISWPIGLGGAVQGSLSGVENIRFISRVYGTNFQETYALVADFCELGAYLREPVNTYSSGMRAKFSFGISFAVKFDCYLVDEAISVGDVRFKKKCREALMGGNTGLILISHSRRLIEEYCDSAVVLHEGRAYAFERLVDAIEFHEGLLI
jgi:capsular polysaccharide transport system ATP-binding protein